MATHVYQIKIVTSGEEQFGGDTILNLAKGTNRVPLTDYVVTKLQNLLATFGGGGAGGAGGGAWLELYIDKGEGATAPAPTVTISGAVSPGDTVTVNGVIFTAVASNPGNLQFLASATPAISAASLALAINGAVGQLSTGGQTPNGLQQTPRPDLTALFGQVSAAAAAGVVTLTARIKVPEANALTLAKAGTNIAVSAATFTGGSAPTVARFD